LEVLGYWLIVNGLQRPDPDKPELNIDPAAERFVE
jgi:hypothetical protein